MTFRRCVARGLDPRLAEQHWRGPSMMTAGNREASRLRLGSALRGIIRED